MKKLEGRMKKRLANLMADDGKTFILAMDHAMIMNIGEKLPDPKIAVKMAMENGCDALLTNAGTAEYCLDVLGNKGLLIRGDAGTSSMHWSGKTFDNSISTASVEWANKLGADAYIDMLFTNMKDGNQDEKTLERVAKNAALCRDYGMAYVVESVPGGFTYPDVQNMENISYSSRLAAEMGADLVKTVYVDDENYQTKVIDTCFKPIVVLGGGTGKSNKELFQSTKNAMNRGCVGVAYGRLIWSNPEIGKLCKAISKIIHEDISVDEALRIME
jgi:class I fructose-bisphosphate aldolase